MKSDSEKPFWEILFFCTLGLLIATWLLPLLYWSSLPELIPVHFNGRGEADGMGSRFSLFLVPATASVLFCLLAYFGRRPVLWEKYQLALAGVDAGRLLEALSFLCAAMFFFLQYMLTDAARSARMPGYFWIFWVFISLFIFIVPVLQALLMTRRRRQ